MSQETKNYQYERNDFNTYGVRGSASGGGTEVVANPTLAGTEDGLTGLQVGETKYKVEQPINVVANPTLAGTENALTGLEVGNTKYKVDSGMTNPMTTAGDIIYGGENGLPTRLAKPSSSNQFLRNSSNGFLTWVGIGADTLIRPAGLLGQCLYSNSDSAGTGFASGKPGQNFGLGTLTTAPSSANTDGLKIVVLTAEPATYYDGYYYIIAPTT